LVDKAAEDFEMATAPVLEQPALYKDLGLLPRTFLIPFSKQIITFCTQ
jgi:hypothetical protein